MIVTYDVSCFERELKVIFSDDMKAYEKEILQVLDDAYYEWHSPEEIEDEEERRYVECACCEEHMMFRLSAKFPQWEDWASEYYGNNEEEKEEEIYWTSNKNK